MFESAAMSFQVLAELGFVLRGELRLQFGVTDEALRVRTVVHVAPVAFLLKLGREQEAAVLPVIVVG